MKTIKSHKLQANKELQMPAIQNTLEPFLHQPKQKFKGSRERGLEQAWGLAP
jgi:hypothetical protein